MSDATPGQGAPHSGGRGNGRGNMAVQVLLSQREWASHLADETKQGLGDLQPWTPPVWFYDQFGSDLFEQITKLPEYYPTRAERAILEEHAEEIVQLAAADTIVELGAGSAEKTRLLLEAAADTGHLHRFVGVDCSEEMLAGAAQDIAAAYPHIAVDAVVADFNAHLPNLARTDRRLIMFLGSTIGNFDDPQRSKFLSQVAETMGPRDSFLLGTDLVKDTARLVAAYDDSAGVTAAFNRNALDVMNRELGADFDAQQFTHRAVWNPDLHRIEMHLVASSEQEVTVRGLGDLRVAFHAGEHLRTEISTKFTPDQVAGELEEAGLGVTGSWTDPSCDYLLTMAAPLA